MRVGLVVTASQQLVRAIEVVEATIEQTTAQLGAWDAAGLRVPSAIVGTSRPELLELPKLLSVGVGAMVAPRLSLAIGERELAGVADLVAGLRSETGVHLAVTDVGASPGGDFGYLAGFPADLIVLAPQIVDADGSSPLVAEICELARELSCTTLAPGVTDPEQRSALVQSGVDLIAGSLVGGEVGSEHLAALLISQAAVIDPRPMPARGDRPPAAAPPRSPDGPETRPRIAPSPPTPATPIPASSPTPAPAAATVPPPPTEPAAPKPAQDEAALGWRTETGETIVGGWASAQGLGGRKRSRLFRRRRK